MSNNLVFGAIGFVLGGILGGLLAGTFLGKEYKKRVDAMQYEIDCLTESIQNDKSNDIQKREEAVKKSNEKLSKSLGYSSKSDDDDDKDFDSDDDIKFDDPFTDIDETSDEDAEKTIRVITREAYDEDLLYRDSETLTFYQQDGILTDDLDEPVQNATDIIGMEAFEKAENTDEETIYVDNEFEDKLYEVLIEKNESFYRDISR